MSEQIKLTINGKEFTAEPSETILNIARRNNIFIPAICYLNSCSQPWLVGFVWLK